MKYDVKQYLNLCLSALLLTCLPWLTEAHEPGHQTIAVSPPEQGFFRDADIASDGHFIIAWDRVGPATARIETGGPGGDLRQWTLSDLSVKGVTWVEPNESFVLASVDSGGPEHRLYRITQDGKLNLQWSTSELAEDSDNVTISPDGRHWLRTELEEVPAEIVVGEVGESQANYTWLIDPAVSKDLSAMHIAEYSYAAMAELNGDTVVVALYGGTLWWTPLEGSRLQPVFTDDCRRVDSFHVTRAGLWVECVHLEEDSQTAAGRSWLLYEPGPSADELSKAPDARVVAKSPLFLRDAIVTLADHGKVDVLGLSDRGVSRVAELELSSEAASTRMLPAGDGFVEISRGARQIRLHLPATRPGVRGGER